MADPAHEAADRTIEGLRREFELVYRKAEKEARRALERHLERFAEEDARMAERVEKGEVGEEDYRHWREVKMLNGDSYRALIDQAARGYADAGAYASAAVEGRLPEVYAENVNYGTYQVESAARVDTAFALQDADTVQRLVTDGASYLPRVSHDVAKDALWNRKLLAGQITQGVMLGESIPKIAARVARVTGQNVAGATRVARTSVTAAECAGRVDSYARAKSMGIDLKQEWLATLDGRTRRSHRKLDGEKVDVGGTFSNGCRYPGDPQASYAEICNCRCTLIAAVEGVDYSDGKRWSRLPDGMTYEDWKAGKPAVTGAKPADRTISEFMGMPGTKRKLDAAGVSPTEARKRLTEQLKEYGIPSGSFRKMSAGDQQKVLDTAILGIGTGGKAGNGLSVVGKLDVGDKKGLRTKVEKMKESIRHEKVEHAYVIQRDGTVLHGSGDASSVNIDGANLDGATVLHNHPTESGEHRAPGSDDYRVLRSNPTMRLIAVDEVYDYELTAGSRAFVSYNEAYRNGMSFSANDDQQHNIMEWLARNGYVDYSRKKVRGD